MSVRPVFKPRDGRVITLVAWPSRPFLADHDSRCHRCPLRILTGDEVRFVPHAETGERRLVHRDCEAIGVEHRDDRNRR